MASDKILNFVGGRSCAVLGLGVSNLPIALSLHEAGIKLFVYDKNPPSALGEAAQKLEREGSKSCRQRNIAKLILRGHSYPDPKTRQRQHKNLQANITDEHRCKTPQQNFSKQNSATHQKAHTP